MSITIIQNYVKLITPGASANRSDYFPTVSIDTSQTNGMSIHSKYFAF